LDGSGDLRISYFGATGGLLRIPADALEKLQGSAVAPIAAMVARVDAGSRALGFRPG
jgi:hypothetical protein